MTHSTSEAKGLAGKLCAGDFMPAEERCAQMLRELRWKEGVWCPLCRSKSVVKYGRWGQ